MQTVVELDFYLRKAAAAGMTEQERQDVVTEVANDPTGGTALGGGLFKRRVAGRGKGKSGGYRIMLCYVTEARPVYLLSILSKGSAGNFSAGELKQLELIAKAIRS